MEERRDAHRARIFKGAKICFHDGNSVVDCVVRNVSPSGARLKAEHTSDIPEIFMLHIAEPATGAAEPNDRECRIVWRTATEIGVAFL